MRVKQYSAFDIDEMRAYTGALLDVTRGGWGFDRYVQHSAVIEDRLRTYMQAGLTHQELLEQLGFKLREYHEAKKVFEKGRIEEVVAGA